MGSIKEADFPMENLDGKYKLAIWTDKADFLDKDASVPYAGKLLELRAFDETQEIRYYRSYVGEDFYVRVISDETEKAKKDYGDYFDRSQYLDIDEKRSANVADGTVFAIGGGSYHLPAPGARRLMVRYYFKYDADGVAYVYDKRIVGFLTEDVKSNNKTKDGPDNVI